MASEAGASFIKHPLNSSLDLLLAPTRHHLQEAWAEDLDFFSKFFPVDSHVRETFATSRKGLQNRGRWTGIPSNPVSVSRLYTPLNNLINILLDKFCLLDDHHGNRRLSLNTSKGVEPPLKYPIHPSLLIAGSGKHFLAFEEACPDKHYSAGISPIVIRLESQDEAFARDCLGLSVQELISYQHNRRYVFGVVMSQRTVVVHLFDRSGVTSSPPLDYHSNPEQFCAIVHGLASHDIQRLGFDPSLFRHGLDWTLRTQEVVRRTRRREVKYTIITTLYYIAIMISRGTICFEAFDQQDGKQYVIKDSWISVDELEGKESEASLLAHARSCGVSKGIPLIRHSEEVHVRGEAGRERPDTILNNRRISSPSNLKLERIHTRIILSPYGKPLDKFSNRRELLLAYYDALQAHRTMHSVAGILHRDIKPGNILINPAGEEGNRGILIDYDHAIRTADTSPYSTKRKIGTYIFMSRNALKGIEPQTCLDDLESFYYVILYISRIRMENKLSRRPLPPPLEDWDHPRAHFAKHGFISTEFDFAIDPRLGKPFQTLVARLHSVFTNLLYQKLFAERRGDPPPAVDHNEIYDLMLSHVRDAIDELNRETNDGITMPRKLSHEEANVITQNEEEPQSSIESWSMIPACKKIMRTLATNRARRKKSSLRVTDQVRSRPRHSAKAKRKP